MPLPTRAPRFYCQLDVTVQDQDRYPKLVRQARSVNVSRTGLLMHVPRDLDVVPGEEVIVQIRYPGGTHESAGLVVRIDRAESMDAGRTVMGIRLALEVPDALLGPLAADTPREIEAA